MLVIERRSTVLLRVAIISTFFATPPLPSFAQGTNEASQDDTRSRILEREGVSQRILSAAEEAALFIPLDKSQQVEYADILANPDNIELNFRWAQTQIARGDLTGASATLERILLIQPELARVRLFYAFVLFRLDSVLEAEEEFLRLQGMNPPKQIRAQIDEYLRKIRKRRQVNHYSASFTGGINYDTNRAAVAQDEKVLIADNVFATGPGNGIDGDWGAMGLVDLRMERDLGYQEGHRFTAGLSYYHSEQLERQEFDTAATTLDIGAVIRGVQNEVRPKVFSNLIQIDGETYMRSLGAEIGFERSLSPQTKFKTSARSELEGFKDTTSATTADDRSGWRSQTRTSINHAFTQRHRSSIALNGTYKSADEHHHAYVGGEVTASHTWILGGGQFVASVLSVSRDVYRTHDDTVSARRRVDVKTRAKAIYGVPIATLIGDSLGKSFSEMVLTMSIEQLWAESNIINYDYNNRKVSFLFTKRFDY